MDFSGKAEKTTEDFIPCNLHSSKHETTATDCGHIQTSLKYFRIYLTLSQITTYDMIYLLTAIVLATRWQ